MLGKLVRAVRDPLEYGKGPTEADRRQDRRGDRAKTGVWAWASSARAAFATASLIPTLKKISP